MSARHVIVTSQATAGALANYGVDRARIAVVEPGTDRAPLARGTPTSTVHLLCVAAFTPRKGHETFFGALATISTRDWRLTCVGSLDRDPALVQRLRAQLRAHRLEDRVSLVGEVTAEALALHYDRSDVFVLPTLHEGYGMAVAEALSRGLPVISTRTGAIAELVSDQAGVVVMPGATEALAGALSDVLGSAELRERYAQGARRVRDRLPAWEVAIERMASILDRVAVDG